VSAFITLRSSLFCSVYHAEFITSNAHLYSFGGPVFWFVSELAFATVYAAAWTTRILPPTAKRWMPPAVLVVADSPAGLDRRPLVVVLTLHLIQAVGAASMCAGASGGLCLALAGFYLYICSLSPLLYCATYGATGASVSSAQPTLLFSYSAHVDDHLDDEVAVGGALPVEVSDGYEPPILRQ
jgi:hypothetical protein